MTPKALPAESAESEDLRTRLSEAEETLEAIRNGAVDAIVVSGRKGEQVYALQAANEPYRLLVESINEGALLLTTDGIILYGNKQFADMMGLSQDRIVGTPFLNCVSKDNQPDFEKMFRNGNVKNVRFQSFILSHTGERIPAQISISIAYIRSEPLITAVITNLMERTLAEQSLRESERLFRSTFEQAAVGMAHVSLEGRFIRINRRFCDIVGYGREELLALTFQDVTHPDDLEMDLSFARQVVEGLTDTYSIEKRYVRKDGHFIWVHLTVALLRGAAGNPMHFTSVVEDISKRKRLEEELERHRRHLEEMVEERTMELASKNITLQELNATLRVLLKQREDDKKEMEERFVTNVQDLVLPHVKQLKGMGLDIAQQSYLGIIEAHLREIAAPLMKDLRQFNLTPKEMKVAALVRQGKSTKEIVEITGTASGSIGIHRKHIRKKLGLRNRKANLQAFLESIGE